MGNLPIKRMLSFIMGVAGTKLPSRKMLPDLDTAACNLLGMEPVSDFAAVVGKLPIMELPSDMAAVVRRRAMAAKEMPSILA